MNDIFDNGWTWMAIAVFAFAILIVSLLVFYRHEQNALRNITYPIWVKQTGNPKNLTVDEWMILQRWSRNQDTQTLMPIIVR